MSGAVNPMDNPHSNHDPNTIQLPRPTAWPMVMALGVSLLMAGLVTSIEIGILGIVLTIAGIIGWFFQVFPHAILWSNNRDESFPVGTDGHVPEVRHDE